MFDDLASVILLCFAAGFLVGAATVSFIRRDRPDDDGTPDDAGAAGDDGETEERINDIAGTVRGLLLSIAGSVRKVDAAADDSSAALSTVRTQLHAIEPAEDLEEAYGVLVSEIDRVITANAEMKRELGDARKRLSSQRHRIDSLDTAARTDPLTRLANRGAFDQYLEAALELHRNGAETLSLLMVDLDHFKSVNDTYGHTGGDRVLAGVGLCLREAVRSDDVPARYGGEEFAVILPGSGLEQAAATAERIRAIIEAAVFDLDDKKAQITTSVGVAEVRPRDAAVDIVERADRALYDAKRAGRNRVRVARDGSSDE